MPRLSSETAMPPVPSSETADGDRIRSSGYFGAKAGQGVWQTIINQIPPHEQFVEAFCGSATISRRIRPCRSSIVIDSDAAVCDPLKDVPGLTVICGDAIEWLANHTHLFLACKTVIYLDPPYLFSSRSGGRRKRYGHEFGEEWLHGPLLKLLARLAARGLPVLVSHPRHALYDRLLTNWRRVDYRCPTRGGPRTESLYCSFPQPAQLHDYRFAGANFRERERLKRKRTRWKARLSAMPALERSIILEALRELDLASP